MRRLPLPIDDVLDSLLHALRAGPNVVLVAPTGAGKTTRVPAALFDAEPDAGAVWVSEPRRLAARAAARRVARERGGATGREVGYHVRFDRKATNDTRIIYATEGILVRRMQADPFLEGVGAIVFDEFHERSLDVDLALALARAIQRDARPDLRIVVMSATLDPDPVAEWFGGCPVVRSEGRLHPVEVVHMPPSDRDYVRAAAQAVRQEIRRGEGDVLTFLPGVGEIRRAAEFLADLDGVDVLQLFGDLDPRSQDRVLEPSDRQKVVLATNVAESSVTIPGVRVVVDTGLARVLRFDPAVGLDRLELERISRASADQRAGRAGREAPGRCVRLWPEAAQQRMPERDTAEVARVDLTRAALELRAWGVGDGASFEWFEAPAPDRWTSAQTLLEALGAVSGDALTPLGRKLASITVHPRLARLLVEGGRLGVRREAAVAAAVLSERDILQPLEREQSVVHVSQSDVTDRVEIVLGLPTPVPDHRIRRGRIANVRRVADRLASLARAGDAPPPLDVARALRRALLAAFPDRVAALRSGSSERAVMVGGAGVRIGRESAVRNAELFVAIDVVPPGRGAGGEGRIRQASALEQAWLDPSAVVERTEAEFDEAALAVRGRRRLRYCDLVLSEREAPVDAEQAATALVAAASSRLTEALPLDSAAAREFLGRIRSLAEWMPELDLPRFEDEELVALLPELCAGRRSFAELRRADLLSALRSRLDHQQWRALEQWAPARIRIPTGRMARLEYEPGKQPVLAARIQELFGLTDTPHVAAGRVSVVVHLLAPNNRPQQVTTDLRGFWERGYPEVRKELRARYPKHAWPEDPRDAQPEDRPRGKRRRPGGG